MIDYDFYSNTYLGSAIPEKAFSEMAARAYDALQWIRRSCQVRKSDEVSEKMALCAMAETLYADRGRRAGVTAATVGGVSVRYEGGSTAALRRELLYRAGIYLDICRGVSI